jgi:uncharacterized membrane protein YdjX (TVP38/TMEM64 family)
MLSTRLRAAVLIIWGLVILGGVYVYLSRSDVVGDEFVVLSSSSVIVAAMVYLVMGCVRGFTLIPVTYLIPFGLLFLSPAVHFLLTMAGIAVSSASIYYFAERLRLAEYFEVHHARHVNRLRELPIVVAWSFFPFVPTDLICYACGSLGVGAWKLLAGVLVGEGIICAVYIFLGRQLLSFA